MGYIAIVDCLLKASWCLEGYRIHLICKPCRDLFLADLPECTNSMLVIVPVMTQCHAYSLAAVLNLRTEKLLGLEK